MATLLGLQHTIAEKQDVPNLVPREAGHKEGDAWSAIEARLDPVLDWSLTVADEWKEKSRLDDRRSFKVLDQPLRLQMQTVAEADPAKLRKRCTPPPGRHSVIGCSAKES